MEKRVEQIVEEIKSVDNNVNQVIVPMLKDTITDYRKIVFKLIGLIVFLILGIIATGIVSQVIVAKQNEKYNDFLSQFEYEAEETYTQDLDTGEGGDIINSSINAAD